MLHVITLRLPQNPLKSESLRTFFFYSPLASWTFSLHAYHIGTESPFWFPLWPSLSLRAPKQWLEWVVPQQTAPLWIQAQQFHIAGTGAWATSPQSLPSCKSCNDITATSKSSFPHNSFKSHHNGKRWVYCRDDKWESSPCLFGRLCPRGDLSAVCWDRTDCAIVGLECQMLSASCSTKSSKQFEGTPYNMCSKTQRGIYWQGHVYITVAHRVARW